MMVPISDNFDGLRRSSDTIRPHERLYKADGFSYQRTPACISKSDLKGFWTMNETLRTQLAIKMWTPRSNPTVGLKPNAPFQSEAAPRRVGFNDLPGEIRNQIYHEAFVEITPIAPAVDCYFPHCALEEPALTCCDPRARREGLYFYYSGNVFRFDGGMGQSSAWAKFIGNKANAVRHIEFAHTVAWSTGALFDWRTKVVATRFSFDVNGVPTLESCTIAPPPGVCRCGMETRVANVLEFVRSAGETGLTRNGQQSLQALDRHFGQLLTCDDEAYGRVDGSLQPPVCDRCGGSRWFLRP